MSAPYYTDATTTLYLGDMHELVPTLTHEVDCVVTDPPYGETSLAWDRWPDGWPSLMPGRSMWCFGSMRMFLDRRDEFAGWRLSQDVVWEKHNGSGIHGDRFRRVHEHALHWYRGLWAESTHDTPTEPAAIRARAHRRHGATPHLATTGQDGFIGGTVLMRSVIRVHSMHGKAIHPTEKPVGILDPLLRYACPPGGTVLDPFAGSGSTADAARASGRRAVLIEAHEPYCEVIAKRLAQGDLFGEVTA